MALDKYRNSADPIWEERINQLEEGRRLIAQGIGFFGAGASTAEPTIFDSPWANAITLSSKVAEPEEKPLQIIKLESAAWKATKLITELVVTINAAAPTTTFIGGIFKLKEISGGAAKKTAYKFEAITAASEAKVATPAKETVTVATTTFEFPAAGNYGLGINIEGTTAANSMSSFQVNLYASN